MRVDLTFMKDYPLFIPPEELAAKGAKKWTKREARAYFDWFQNEKEKRVENFLSFMRVQLTGSDETDLGRLAPMLYAEIGAFPFSEINEVTQRKKLTNMGLALAADMGLLMSGMLQAGHPELYWEIGSGPKSYHGYNLPVLKEFKSGAWDPVFSSINKNGYSLNEAKAPYDWSGFFSSLNDSVICSLSDAGRSFTKADRHSGADPS
jgi:hypothetical protein